MKRGEMLTGRSVSADCGLRIAECGFHVTGRRQWVGRLVFGVALLCVFAGLLAVSRFGFGASAAQREYKSADGVWQTTRTLAGEWTGRSGVPESARVVRLDEAALRQVLQGTENRDGETGGQGDGGKEGSSVELWLPMPGGEFERFRVVEAPVMRPELAAQLPDIKSYRGWGVDNPLLTMRCDLSPLGFHAAVTDGAELMAIHPVEQNEREHYVSYSSRSYAAAAESALCLVNDAKVIRKITPTASRNSSVGANKLSYDVAITTTQEYTNQFCGGDQSCTIGTLTTWFGALNLIFDRELSIHLNLVTNFSLIYQFEPDPFSNGILESSQQQGTGMVDQVRTVLGNSGLNYDLGLVLGTGNGGSAYVGVVCETASDGFGPYRGGGAMLVNGLVGNTASANLMAHEIGHQFGATHTQNALNCGVRSGDTAYETGSGLTLMSNAGACTNSSDNIATARSSYFHSGSFEQIVGYLNVLGGACATVSNAFNSPPVVNGGADYVIPRNTPFALMASGSDADNDPLTYSWEQIDAGGSNFWNPPYTDAGDSALTTRPIFRPFDPGVNNAVRIFPTLSGILNGQNLAPFENLPNVNRFLNFRVTARDGRGGVANDTVQLQVDSSAGPFAVTSANSGVTWAGGSLQTVTWNVSGTGAGTAVNCASVNILISTDGGQTFSTLLGNTPNDGTQQVTIPNIATSTARIKVAAADNVFFDISDANFTITSCPAIPVNPSVLANGFVGVGYSQTITATGGFAPYTYTVNAGTLPNGLTLSSGGILTGTPTTIGVFNFTVLATASNGCQGSRAYTVVISGNGLMFYPLSSPVRLLDTRAGQSACVVTGAPITALTTLTQVARNICSIPSNAQAVTGNVTVYSPPGNGFLTLYPSDAAQPFVANTNYRTGINLENVFTVGLGASDGAFKIYTTQTVNVEVDITGYFAPPGTNAMYFHPLPAPVRLLDTRAGQTACTTPGASLAANSETLQQGSNICGIPSTAKALVGNATTVGPTAQGNLVLFRSDVARPPITSGNYESGQTLNSPFLTALSPSGQLKIYTSAQTDLVIDILGYYSLDGTDTTSGVGLLYSSLTPIRLLDTRVGQSACTMPGAPMMGGTEYWQAAAGNCTIASVAKAIVGNATTVSPQANGFLTLWPSDASRPFIATSNYALGINFNRYFTVGLGSDGGFRRYAFSTTDLVIDVSGYYAP